MYCNGFSEEKNHVRKVIPPVMKTNKIGLYLRGYSNAKWRRLYRTSQVDGSASRASAQGNAPYRYFSGSNWWQD